MDRGSLVTVHGVEKESDTIKQLNSNGNKNFLWHHQVYKFQSSTTYDRRNCQDIDSMTGKAHKGFGVTS